jgi:cAMP phosphodiesterase
VIIRVLGCHGSELTVVDGKGHTHECRTCGFLVNETCMVDAGSVSAGLQEDEQGKIRHVLLSHAHFDHIKGLPLLADNLAGRVQNGPVKIHALAEVLDGLRRHIFNDVVFPDFTRLPTVDSAPLAYHAFNEEKAFTFDNLEVTAVRVNHIVPTAGFIVRQGDSALLYSGDTSETRRIWEVAAKEPRLKAAFIETSFPNDFRDLAKVTGHLTPDMLAREFAKLGRPDLPVYIYHIKPSYRHVIAAELKRLNLPNLHVLEEDQVVRI